MKFTFEIPKYNRQPKSNYSFVSIIQGFLEDILNQIEKEPNKREGSFYIGSWEIYD